MTSKQPFVYIITNKRNGTLYAGVTSNLPRRIAQHKAGTFEGFSKKHGLDLLVWYEAHADMENAILREKKIKKYRRAWKLELIEALNPDWEDLYAAIAK
ncbi:MAG: GIY-YIG nuclease family protein [Alphaproteobacteria bacterium]